VLRINVALFWVNAAGIQEAILHAVDETPGTKALVLDMEATHQFGVTSADMLSELRTQLAEREVDLYLVRVRWPVRTVLARSGFRAQLGEDHLWHGLSQAVRVARRKHGIERPGHAEPEPIVVEGADEVEEAKDEVVAASTLDDAAESEAPQRTVSGFSDRREGRSTGRADQEV
jgi:sulfate permease, SulP family